MSEATDQQVKRPVERASASVVDEQVANLRRLFPEAVCEGKIDFDKLRATLGDSVETRPERFSFTWAGKSEAIGLLQTPSRATLVPCPEESINFDTTQHLFIEGDNLEVLKLFFKPYFGRVKMIYIDPPYNTGQDFIYPDDYADPLKTYLKLTGQADAEGNLLTSNPETSGRYHSAWLSMMYPRLFLARQLLTEDGVIFVSIDDHEVHHLRMLMNEVFGEESFLGTIVIQANKRGQTYKDISKTHEYLLVWGREPEVPLLELAKSDDALPYTDSKGPFDLWELRNRNPKFGRNNRPNLYFPVYVAPLLRDETGYSKVSLEKSEQFSIEVLPKDSNDRDSCWRWGKDKIAKEDLSSETPVVLGKQRRDGGWNIYERSRKSTTKPKSIWTETEVISEQGTVELGKLGLGDVFDHPKPVGLIKKCLQIAVEEDEIVLDFFAGSCSTAQAVFGINREDGSHRRFIMVQLPEPTGKKDYPTIADIGKERIRRVIAKLKKEDEGKLPSGEKPQDLGFKVFKLHQPNIQPWLADANRDPETYREKLSLFNDPLVAGWTAENVLWEVALREGFSLNTRFQKKELGNGNTIHEVTDADKDPPQTFIACLDDAIRADFSKHCELTADQLLVCRDKALDDTAAANLALQCRLKTI